MVLSLQTKLHSLLNRLLSSVPWMAVVSQFKLIYWLVRNTFRFDFLNSPGSVEIRQISASSQYCGSRPEVAEEIRTIVHCISKDYIKTWYHSKVSDDPDFVDDVDCIVRDTLTSFCNAISNVERKQMITHFLQLYLHFFVHFKEALSKVTVGKGTLETCLDMQQHVLAHFNMHHQATKDNLTEWCYLQSIVSMLVDSFGPVDLLTCPLLHTLVVEILSQNMMYAVVNTLTDPNRLNSWIARLMKIDLFADHPKPPPPATETQNQSVQNPEIVLPEESSDAVESANQDDLDELSASSKDIMLNVTNSSNQSSIQSSDIDFELGQGDTPTNSSSALNTLAMPIQRATSNLSLHRLKSTTLTTTAGLLDVPNAIKRSKSADYIKERQLNQGLLPLNASNSSIRLHSKDNKMFVGLRQKEDMPEDVEVAEEASEVPPLFTDISITDIEQYEDASHLPYTLYCIQYSGLFQDVNSEANVPVLVRQVINIKRRFREFLTLHSRLEDNPVLKLSLKGIKGPSKGFPMLFGNMEKKYIADRKVFLEAYLRDLSKQIVISRSAELQEFLAYGGDASIAYVKKNSDLNVPRIDKMILKGVKDAMDIFKFALPVPFEGISNDAGVFALEALNNQKPMPETKFPEYSLEYNYQESEVIEHIEDFFSRIDVDSSTESVYNDGSAMHYDQLPSIRKVSLVQMNHDSGCSCIDTVPVLSNMEDSTILGTALADILVEAFCSFPSRTTSPFVQLLNVLPTSLTNDFLESKLDNISSSNCCSILHMFHNSMWPKERGQPRVHKDSLAPVLNKALMEKLELVVPHSVLSNIFKRFVASTGMPEAMELLLGSLQNQALNKCLLYYIFDMLIENLCPKKSLI